MPARRYKTLEQPDHGYVHREHRSKRSLKGLNRKSIRARRVSESLEQRRNDKKLKRVLKQLIRII